MVVPFATPVDVIAALSGELDDAVACVAESESAELDVATLSCEVVEVALFVAKPDVLAVSVGEVVAVGDVD